MLEGRPVLFLSCSERFKADVALPIHHALHLQGVHAVVVSEEPMLPRTGWSPDDKVESYLNASDAFAALATPDDALGDGSIQCRQNIIDEIQRARSKPHLRDRIIVLKEPSVRLPSNISPTYERLDVAAIGTAVHTILRQLDAWGVLPASTPTPLSTEPPIAIGALIEGIGLGDQDKASARAYENALTVSRADQLWAVSQLLQRLEDPDESPGTHILTTVLEAIARVDHSLVPIEKIEELAHSEDTAKRIAAVFLLWDLAESAPGFVPLGLVGRLARPADEDWYVGAPAMAITKLLMLRRQHARLIFDRLACSANATDRFEVAVALLDLASVDATAVPIDLARHLSKDADDLVSQKGWEVLTAIANVDEHAYEKRFRPFGL